MRDFTTRINTMTETDIRAQLERENI